MIFDDDPIEQFSDDFKEDELGRNKFALSLADSIIKYDSKKNLVIGITGEWGYGKTTLINMVLKSLDQYIVHEIEDMGFLDKILDGVTEFFLFGDIYDSEGIIVFNFNPWYFSEQDQLLSYFFLELTARLRKIKSLKHIVKKIGPYAAHVLAAIGIFINPQRTQATITYLDKIGYFDKDADFQSLKTDLFEALESQNKKLLIVLDDIDRLDAKEIREIFKLIKLIANFPNTIYLVSFDRKVVESALDDENISGKEYLKKIVPVMFEIPGIADNEIKGQFFEMISNIKHLDEPKLDILDNLFDSGLKYFFYNIRDLKRFFNTFYFTYNAVKDDVCFVDFVAITAIQVFEPELYNQIRNNMNLFAVIRFNYLIKDEQIKSEINEILDKINFKNSNLRRDIISFLLIIFPKLTNIYGNTDYSFFYPKWMSLKRIFHEEYFHRYFKFYVPEWDVSSQEIEEVLEISETDKFVNYLKRRDKSQLILSEMHWYVQRNEIDSNQINNIISGLLNYGDQIFGDGTFKPSEEVEISRIFTSIYNQIGPESFLDIFKQFINAENIYTVCDYARTLLKERDFLEKNLDSNQKTEFSTFICSKITDILNSEFIRIKNPWIILDFYKRHCDGDLGSVIANLNFKEFIFLLSDIFDAKMPLKENLERINRNYIVKDNLNEIKNKFENIKYSSEFNNALGSEIEFLNLLEKILQEKYKLTYI